MKFVINRDVFSDAVSFAVKLLPQRPAMPILGGVKIEATSEGVEFSTFDFESSARTLVAADVESEGAVLISGRLLSDVASKLPQREVRIEDDGTKVSIRCGSANFSFARMPLEEYPTVPTVQGRTGVVEGKAFAEAVGQVAISASREDVTPVITGVLLEAADTTLSLIATDRYRVSVRSVQWDAGEHTDEVASLVPARTLTEVGRTFGSAEQITLTLSEPGERQQIAFSAGSRTVTSLLIKGNYPPVRRLFPDAVEHYAVVNTAELIDATRRVQLVLDAEAAIRFIVSEGQMQLEAIGSEQAQASEIVDTVLTGDDIVLAIKPQLLIDGVAATHAEFVRLTFTRSESTNKPGPMLIRGQTSRDDTEATDFKYLLQPNLLLR